MARLGVIETRDRRQQDFTEVRARQRLNELQRLVRYRRDNGLDMGAGVAWSIVLSDIALARRRLWTKGCEAEFAPGGVAHADLRKQVDAYFWRLGLGGMVNSPMGHALNAEVWPRLERNPMKLLPAAYIGEILEVTATEREECRLRTIDDVEQGQKARAREAERLRKAEARKAAGATPRAESLAAQRPWESLGISRRTYFRRKQACKLG